jgi:hypothetical protein
VIEPESSTVPAEPQAESTVSLPAAAAEVLSSPTLVEKAQAKTEFEAESTSVDVKPEPIIPLVHAPDDPGPDAFDENEPASEQPDGGWRKILG